MRFCAPRSDWALSANGCRLRIVACEPIRIKWWYGWGIHLTAYGWLYNVSGLNAVAITLRNGRKFALGTDDPNGLVKALGGSHRTHV